MILINIILVVVGAILSLFPLFLISWGIYFLLQLPLRRQERAALFLDLIESGRSMGQSAESSVVSFAKSRDQSMGVRFHLLAAYLETGLHLSQALEKTRHLLPPRLEAMLRTGEEIGDIGKVLPACHRMLRDGVSQTQGAVNYLVLLAFVFTPIFPLPLVVLRIFVLPKWREIFAGLSTRALPPLSEFIFGESLWFVNIQFTIAALLYLAALSYIGGPRLSLWLKQKFSITLCDRIAFRVGWKRKRMQRDFASMLALLLDAEVSEPRAIQLAAESTANDVFVKRAERALHQLASGVKLSDVIQSFDDTGEFRWRLKNSKGTHGLMGVLSGWLDGLDAKAYQLEQSTAQVLTTALVLLNGVMVGLVVTGLFQALIWIVNDVALW